jgi:hypothetical protein
MMKNPSSAKTLAALVGLDNLDCEEAHPANYAMFSEIDFTHPLFAPFADPRFGDFTRIHFWNYRRLNASAINGARVLAKFDSGDPAVLEIARGKGRVLVFTFGWHPQDSQLALSTKFVPLLYSMLEQSGATPPAPSRYEVGDTLPLPTADSSRTIRLPDASQSTLASSATNYSNTKMPGTYIVTSGGVTTRFAVNLDPTESRTAPLLIDELERLGVPVAAQIATVSQTNARKVWLQDNTLESRQKLWRWFVAATVALLLVETWLAGRTNRQQPLAQGAPS